MEKKVINGDHDFCYSDVIPSRKGGGERKERYGNQYIQRQS